MQMYYQVTDMTEEVNGHDILTRTLTPDDPEYGSIAYISCRTCHKMTEYKYPTNDPKIFHPEIMQMEWHLHAEGFDTGWEFGQLDDDDLED